MALCYLEATACNLLRVLTPGPTGETYATGCPPQAGTEIEKISLDQVKIGDTILILHFSSQLCPVDALVSEARGVMDTLASD